MKMRTILAAVVAAALTSTAASAASVYSATTAIGDQFGANAGGHSLTLAGQRYDFQSDGTFVDNGSTASLTGTLENNSGGFYTVDLQFNLFPATAHTGPKNEMKAGAPIDPSTWKLWDLIEGGVSSLIGSGTNAGLEYDVISKPVSEAVAFQSGFGANGKNIKNGLSGWLFLAGRNAASDQANRCAQPVQGMGNTCDFNVDLEVSAVPLPASALLLIGGLAGLGAMRRKSSAA